MFLFTVAIPLIVSNYLDANKFFATKFGVINPVFFIRTKKFFSDGGESADVQGGFIR